MVSMLDSDMSSHGSSPGQGDCIVFKALLITLTMD